MLIIAVAPTRFLPNIQLSLTGTRTHDLTHYTLDVNL